MDRNRRKWMTKFIVVIIFGAICIILEHLFLSVFKSKRMELLGNRPSCQQWYTDNRVGQTTCHMNSCFDYSRCTPSSGFKVYVYGMDTPLKQDKSLLSHVLHVFSQSPYVTNTPERACAFLEVIEETASDIEDRIHSLRFWNDDGSNHILLNIAETADNVDIFAGVDTGKAMVAQTSFIKTLFRDKFDFIISPDFGKRNVPEWIELTPLLPIRRRYLLSFHGAFCAIASTLEHGKSITNSSPETTAWKQNKSYIAPIPNSEIHIVKSLIAIQENTNENLYINETCDTIGDNVLVGEWCLCENERARSTILRNSTFSVMISPAGLSDVSTIVFQTRLFESLKHGAVPVILGDNVVLPYNELLDWCKAVVILPKARAAYMHYYLSALGDDNILAMKTVGRMFWETYFGSTSSIIETTLAVLRGRLLIPPITTKDEESGNKQIANIPRIKQKGNGSLIVTEKVQATVPLIYQHNFSAETLRGMFNTQGDPFHLYPFTPFHNFKSPDIQLKVLILTHKMDRLDVLIAEIKSLKDCPHLNKVVIVWNNFNVPPENITLPEIGVPLIVLNMTKNSLNNRFLPFDVIDTEAILYIDDDITMIQEELVLGFRIWRENRDRIVGYPARFHEWDKKKNKWVYKTSPSCKMSMILTSKAFSHKYYAYLYSYVMPQAIRDYVDTTLNCDDIAINFLVSHISRKPPVMVKAKPYSYSGPGLSKLSDHWEERDLCMNFFAKVFGYMPLLFSHYKADYIAKNVKGKSHAQKCE